MQTATLSSGFIAETADRQEKRRRAIGGAVFSEFIDMFDIYLPTVVLSPGPVLLPAGRDLDPSEQAIFASLVFITTLLGRPVGALAFGVVADSFGRRNGVDLPRSPASASSLFMIAFDSRLSPDRHRLLLAPGDLALSRRHLPRRRLHRRSSAGDRIFREAAARLHRRPDPLRLPGGLRSDHPCRDADVRALSPRRDRFTLRAMGVAHPLRHRRRCSPSC